METAHTEEEHIIPYIPPTQSRATELMLFLTIKSRDRDDPGAYLKIPVAENIF